MRSRRTWLIEALIASVSSPLRNSIASWRLKPEPVISTSMRSSENRNESTAWKLYTVTVTSLKLRHMPLNSAITWYVPTRANDVATFASPFSTALTTPSPPVMPALLQSPVVNVTRSPTLRPEPRRLTSVAPISTLEQAPVTTASTAASSISKVTLGATSVLPLL